MLHKKHSNKGFTTLEVVVVVGAILLVGLVIYFMSNS